MHIRWTVVVGPLACFQLITVYVLSWLYVGVEYQIQVMCSCLKKYPLPIVFVLIMYLNCNYSCVFMSQVPDCGAQLLGVNPKMCDRNLASDTTKFFAALIFKSGLLSRTYTSSPPPPAPPLAVAFRQLTCTRR